MSIATEITRLQNAKSALATSIGNKGVTVPSSTKLDGYAALVDSIQTGGSGEWTSEGILGGTEPNGAIVLDNTITNITDYALTHKNSGITSISSDYVTYIGRNAFDSAVIGSISFPNCTNVNDVAFSQASISSINLPKLSSLNFTSLFQGLKLCTQLMFPLNVNKVAQSCFRDCNALEIVDVGKATSIEFLSFYNSSKVHTIIIRSVSVCSLSNTGAFTGTRFASGGAGGTIYVPSALISSYQSASNWATVYGWGATTFSAIEGSIYE